jgi:hypothetical protein
VWISAVRRSPLAWWIPEGESSAKPAHRWCLMRELERGWRLQSPPSMPYPQVTRRNEAGSAASEYVLRVRSIPKLEVVNPPNLPCWRNFPLAAEVAKVYGVPVQIDNDANGAALAEVRWGAGRGHNSVFYATIGTGIGTGIVFGGHIYHGRTGAAGEGGHMSIDYRGPRCGCGKLGCIEILAAGQPLPNVRRRN